ncbi:MAG: hypothetical protein ACLSCV_00190 [Acutalibacteraceae bacterium]
MLSPDTEWQDFEAHFEFEETEDNPLGKSTGYGTFLTNGPIIVR